MAGGPGRTTGLQYDLWTDNDLDWELVNIKGQLPLKFNEAIVLAQEEKFAGQGIAFSFQGYPDDDGFSFRDIATGGRLTRVENANQLRTFVVGDLDHWINHNDSGGNWHGNPVMGPFWTEEAMADNILSGNTTLPDVVGGQIMYGEWARQQYDVLNRTLWVNDTKRQISSLPEQDEQLFVPDPTASVNFEFEGGAESTVSKTSRHSTVQSALTNVTQVGTSAATFFENTVNAGPRPPPEDADVTIAVGSPNDVGVYGFNHRRFLHNLRTYVPSGVAIEVDVYMFAFAPELLWNFALTDNSKSPLNGQVKGIASFDDGGWPGILENVWTYVYDEGGSFFTGTSSPSVSAEAGWQSNVSTGISPQSAPRDPLSNPDFRRTNIVPFLIRRCNVVGGFVFLDPAINPTISPPAPIVTPDPVFP